jgi:uncharacterized NAD(P)/FAD-binding protein YdhS
MDHSPNLARLVAALERRRRLDSAALADLLRMELSLEDIAPHVRFDEHNYTRTLVASGRSWELRLLSWRPGQSTSLHGHGGSACAFRILSGVATEAVLGRRDRTWTPGDVIDESDRTLVHQVSNTSAEPLLSLHAYSPRLGVDAPSSPEGDTIAIVGGGFAGAALAYHLLRHGRTDLRITWIESGPWLGRGLAYALESPFLRLNVPASRMSLDPSEPDDFVRHAGASDDPHAFLPRAAFGSYVEDRLADAIRRSPSKLRIVRGRAAAIDDRGVLLDDGRRCDAERVVLATGNRSRMPAVTDPRIVDGFSECALAGLPSEGRLLVIGSGLTALDVLTVIDARRFRGSVRVVSRHGLLPRAHASAPSRPLAVSPPPPALRALLAWGRAVVREHERSGLPWQHGIDAIRPHAPAIWRALDSSDRRRFVRSVRAYWEVLRHRAPPAVLDRVTERQKAGAIALDVGAVVALTPRAHGVEATIRGRGGLEKATYDAVVCCGGFAIDALGPLERGLVRELRARLDPAGLGIVTTPDGRLVDSAGRKSDRLFAIGAPLRASNGESTSVPEIARAAAGLAALLVERPRAASFATTVLGYPAPA